MAPPRSRIMSAPIFSLLCLCWLLSSTVLAASAVLGVDIGTEYIKATLVKPGIPLEIVLTKDSRRKEMSAVAFKPSKDIKSGEYPERAYGSDAVALAARFPGDVYPNLKALLGLAGDNSVVTEYASRHPALKLEVDKTRNTAAFRSSAFAGEQEAWTVEEILAMELQSIQKNAEALAGKGSTVKAVVLTIPVFYTAEEKRAVQLAAELAGLRVLELISDGLAVGLNYATARTFPSINDGGKPEHHMVFDMGAGSTKATILKFQGRTIKDVGKYNKTIQEVQVLGSGWDRTLGGDALNAIIVDDMISQFIASPAAKSISPTIESVKGHGRAAAKLWKEAERVRQILSANANTQSSFEGLYEDIDFKYKISRADFEKLSESYAARIGVAMQKALDAADLDVKDLDSIILHGGAIRTPFVQKELEKFVGNPEKVRTNVNSDEAAVFGAAFRGAAISPSFRVKDIRASEGASYAAGIKWTNIYDKPQHQRLWKPTSFLGAEKQYTFKNQKDFSIEFYQHVASSENVSSGSAEKATLTLTTQNLTESVARLKDKFGCTDGDINVKLRTRLSIKNGEVEIVKAVVDCEVDESEEKAGMVDSVKGLFGFGKKDQAPLSEDGDDLAESSSSVIEPASTSSSTSDTASASVSPSPSAKDAKDAKDAKEPKAKPTKRLEVIPLKYTIEINGIPQLPASEIQRMKERLDAFEDSDRSRRLREEALNQLEGFTYKARDLLEKENFISSSTKEERAELETLSSAASEWIYSGGTEASREELKAKLKEMKDIVSPIEIRLEEAAERPEQIKLLKDALEQTQKVIDDARDQMVKDEEAHASFSSSKSAASLSPSATPSKAVDDEFEDLVDKDTTTTTTSAPAEEETMAPSVYAVDDLLAPESLRVEISAWLTEKVAEQEKLAANVDPILFAKEIQAKARLLQDVQVDLIMKGMRTTPPKPKKTATKSKKPKTKKAKSTKTKSGEKADPTLDFDSSEIPIMKAGKDGKRPTEEEMLDFIEKNYAENAAKRAEGVEEEQTHDEL